MVPLAFAHVDVFTSQPYGGNSLAVFPNTPELTSEKLLRIAQEMRHFEAIFLRPADESGIVRARVFDLIEELPFAGHPIIGAAAVLHFRSGASDAATWRFALGDRILRARTTIGPGTGETPTFTGTLDQGRPEFGREILEGQDIAEALSLTALDLDPNLPLAVVSTGLRYLVVPVLPGVLQRVRIVQDLGALVAALGADYAVLLDEAELEIRHWTNDGRLEDAATGSAAGTVGAYLLRYGQAASGETFVLGQGRFVDRPSELRVTPIGSSEDVERVEVGGDVSLLGGGALNVLP